MVDYPTVQFNTLKMLQIPQLFILLRLMRTRQRARGVLQIMLVVHLAEH